MSISASQLSAAIIKDDGVPAEEVGNLEAVAKGAPHKAKGKKGAKGKDTSKTPRKSAMATVGAGSEGEGGRRRTVRISSAGKVQKSSEQEEESPPPVVAREASYDIFANDDEDAEQVVPEEPAPEVTPRKSTGRKSVSGKSKRKSIKTIAVDAPEEAKVVDEQEQAPLAPPPPEAPLLKENGDEPDEESQPTTAKPTKAGKKGKKGKKSKVEKVEKVKPEVEEVEVVMKKRVSIMRQHMDDGEDGGTRASGILRQSSHSRTKMRRSSRLSSSSSSSSDDNPSEDTSTVAVDTRKKPGKRSGTSLGASFTKRQASNEVAPTTEMQQAISMDVDMTEEVLQQIVMPDTAPPPKKKPKMAPKPKPKPKKPTQKGKPVKAEDDEAKLQEAEELALKMAIAERRAAIDKEKRDGIEANLRGEQLDAVVALQETAAAALQGVINEERAAEEWRQYLVCDGLPAPWDVPSLSTYLHLWHLEIPTVTAEECCHRTAEAVKILEKLEDIIDDPYDLTPRLCANWVWIAEQFRASQAQNLESCTYRLLRNVKLKMNRVSIPVADFRVQEELFSMCLYVTVALPTPAPNPRNPGRPRVSLAWPEMDVDVVFPSSLKGNFLAIRGAYLKYDHLTDTCSTYKLSHIPAYYTKTLKQVTRQEYLCKLRYKYDNRVIVPKEPVEVIGEDGTVTLVEPEPDPEIPADEPCPHVPYQKLDPSPSEYCLDQLEDEMRLALSSLNPHIPPYSILNLRRYTVLGGIYMLDLFWVPPQPTGMVSFEVQISTLITPFELATSPFWVQYSAPPPPEPGARRTPESIEEEMLQQEKELDELIFLSIVLPKHVYWIEPPIIVAWDHQEAAWSTTGIFDVKHIEEKGYVTFRVGMFRPMAIATMRWCNLPFQAWEIRPEKDGSVSFQLTCAILTLEFHIRRNGVCVRDVQCAPNAAFDEHLNVYYPFSKLRKIMRRIGIDVFPYFDTFLYVEGTCEKYWPMEQHLYFCMALVSVVYNMQWSRWNVTLDNRAVVYQTRVYRHDRPKQANFDTVLVQPTRALCVDCTEVSAEFSDQPIEGMRFFADVWHMVRSTAAKALRNRIADVDMAMVQTLYRLYRNVRFLSFS